jgi:hypothetical protein
VKARDLAFVCNSQLRHTVGSIPGGLCPGSSELNTPHSEPGGVLVNYRTKYWWGNTGLDAGPG